MLPPLPFYILVWRLLAHITVVRFVSHVQASIRLQCSLDQKLCCLLLQDLEAAMQPDTSLVSIMFVNNEIGVKQPIKEIGKGLFTNAAIRFPALPHWFHD